MLAASRRRLCPAAATAATPAFAHNAVLRSVFSAPPWRVAVGVEAPGQPRLRFTYGDLQLDVLETATRIVLPALVGGAAEGIVGKPAALSPFHPRIPGAVEPLDDGRHNAALLARPGYEFVVGLLAQWAANAMAVPLCHTHHYDPEITYILENSRARLLLADAGCRHRTLPPHFFADPTGNANSNANGNGNGSRFDVRAAADLTEALLLFRAARGDGAGADLLPPRLGPAGGSALATTADGVLRQAAAFADEQARARRLDDRAEALRLLRGGATQRQTAADDLAHAAALAAIPGATALIRMNEALARPDSDCLMVYTSGTTAKPKGVVHTHRSVGNQVRVLQDAWRWGRADVILSCLPLHHVHGLVNVTLTALASEATVVFTPFDSPVRVARRLEEGDITLFMGVPTLYTKLEAAVRAQLSPVEQRAWRSAVSERVRLMVCGSAALPVPILDAWRAVSGHTLLERYGMTEIGMALSQPLAPASARAPGTVGGPLPTVRAYCEEGAKGSAGGEGGAEGAAAAEGAAVGSLMVNSPSVFSRYWANPASTAKEVFRHPATGEVFFKTGDTVRVDPATGTFAILGRSSVDIIKSRGFKLSALEIEAEILRCPGVAECAVVGAADPVQGEAVCAVVVADSGVHATEAAAEAAVRAALASRMAPYKVPSRYVVRMGAPIPRNAMGKINKKQLARDLGLV